MCRIGEAMAFMLVDNQLGFCADGLERMPELIRLRSRTLAVAVSHKHQTRRLCLLDKGDRRTLRINLGIVIDGCAEERDHPLINLVFSVVALEIRQPRAGDGSSKAVGLCDRPHRHVTAIAPASDAESMLINRCFLQGLIHSAHNVAKIAIPEVLHVGAGKGLALSEASARVGHEHEIPRRGERDTKAVWARPTGVGHSAGAAVDLYHHGILFCRVKIYGKKQPALQVESVILPMNTLGFSPGRLQSGIARGDLLPLSYRSCPYFRRMSQGVANH